MEGQPPPSSWTYGKTVLLSVVLLVLIVVVTGLGVYLTASPKTACGDLALNKPVIASGYWEDGRPERVVDGILETSWRTDQSTGAWWYVDLGSVDDINQVRLIWF